MDDINKGSGYDALLKAIPKSRPINLPCRDKLVGKSDDFTGKDRSPSLKRKPDCFGQFFSFEIKLS